MEEERIEEYIKLFIKESVFPTMGNNRDELKLGWEEKLKDVFSDFEYEIRRKMANKVKEIIKYGE